LETLDLSRPLGEVVYGYIQAKPMSDKCNNATRIWVSVATRGYGPLMYDLVMADNPNGIIPDRSSTSSQAVNVWRHYANDASIEAKPLDDIDEPKTPDPTDDCEFVYDKLLDQSFSGRVPTAAAAKLRQVHDATVRSSGLPKQEFESSLFQVADGYFTQRYGH